MILTKSQISLKYKPLTLILNSEFMFYFFSEKIILSVRTFLIFCRRSDLLKPKTLKMSCVNP